MSSETRVVARPVRLIRWRTSALRAASSLIRRSTDRIGICLVHPRLTLIISLIVFTFLSSSFAHGQRTANGVATFQFSERWFEQSCFGQLTEAMARRSCQELLVKRIELANESVNLSDDQSQKLMMAGQTDIHRYFAEFDTLKRDFTFRNVTADEWEKLRPKVGLAIEPFATRIVNGLNGDHSLYSKTLSSQVDAASVDKIQADYRQFARDRYALKINQTLSQTLRSSADRAIQPPTTKELQWKLLDQPIRIDLSKAQEPAMTSVRENIVRLLLQHGNPPEFYGNSRHYVTIVSQRMHEIQPQLDEFMVPKGVENREILPKLENVDIGRQKWLGGTLSGEIRGIIPLEIRK